MTKEELKQMLIDNVQLYIRVDKDECCGTTLSVSIYFDDEEIISWEDYI